MEYCKGCYTKDECLYIEGTSETIICPCGTCLVKAMCATVCDDYRDFADKAFRIIIEKDIR
jgi:hypothetical protein